MAERDHRMDNLRCILIVLVVFCHLLVDACEGPLTSAVYRFVLVFHMPAFVFVTGYFARWRPAKVASGLLLPYIEFQLINITWRNCVAGRALFDGVTFAEPSWTLWYLLACVVWYTTVPLLERARPKRTGLVVSGVAMAVSIAVGFVPWVGQVMDLSRIIVLYPFFCAGFYAGRRGASLRVAELEPHRLRRLQLAATLLVIALMAAYYANGYCFKHLLYRDTPYESFADCITRLILQMAACAWIVWLVVVTPARALPVITSTGRNTLPIYLLHLWFIRGLRLVYPLPGGEAANVLLCLGLAMAFCALVGRDSVGRAFRTIFCGGWLLQRTQMCQKGSIPL